MVYLCVWHYTCAYAAQRTCDNTEPCKPILGTESIFSVNIHYMFQMNIVHQYPDIWSAVNLVCIKIPGFPFLKQQICMNFPALGKFKQQSTGQ